MKPWISALAVAGMLLMNGRLVGSEKKKLDSMGREAARAMALDWLKGVGKTDADATKRFETIWKDSKVAVLDMLVETFLLGDAKAAEIMKQARDPMAPPPIAVPAMLKDSKLPVFFRANLAVGYAQALNTRRVHEEALQTLMLFGPEQVADPALYLLQRGMAENALLLQKAAELSFNRLREDVSGAPEHYRKTAAAKLAEMETWKENDTATIARKMKAVERRLGLGRGGKETQKIQKEITEALEELFNDQKAREDRENNRDEIKLLGTWIAEKVFVDGKEAELNEMKIEFRSKEINTFSRKKLESAGTFAIDSKQKPKTIDVNRNFQKHPGIYQLEGDTLKIALAPIEKGRIGKRPTDFDGKQGSLVILKKFVDPRAPKLLSLSDELKMIRALQEKINKSTEQLALRYQEKEGEQASDPGIRQELSVLQKRQENIYQATYRITRN